MSNVRKKINSETDYYDQISTFEITNDEAPDSPMFGTLLDARWGSAPRAGDHMLQKPQRHLAKVHICILPEALRH